MKVLLVMLLLFLLSGCYTSDVPLRSDYYVYDNWYGWWGYGLGYNWYPPYYYSMTPEVIYPLRWKMPHPIYNAPRHENVRPVPPIRHETFRPPVHPPPPQNPGTQPAHPPRNSERRERK